MALTADLRQFVYALSDALGLVGVDDAAHGKRVGVMAAEFAKTMGWTAHLDTTVRADTRPAAA
jgi:hypothetical protein